MRVGERSGPLVASVGLALLASSLLLPPASLYGNADVGLGNMYFFLPVEVTITLGSFNGTATLLVSPYYENANLAPPIVNITVYPKESVEFSVPARGYYLVEVANSTAGVQSLQVNVNESGTPLDLVLAGSALVAAGAVLSLFSWGSGKGRKDPGDDSGPVPAGRRGPAESDPPVEGRTAA